MAYKYNPDDIVLVVHFDSKITKAMDVPADASGCESMVLGVCAADEPVRDFAARAQLLCVMMAAHETYAEFARGSSRYSTIQAAFATIERLAERRFRAIKVSELFECASSNEKPGAEEVKRLSTAVTALEKGIALAENDPFVLACNEMADILTRLVKHDAQAAGLLSFAQLVQEARAR